MSRILVLAGTTEARRLCAVLATAGLSCRASLAGRVPEAAPYPVPCRIGGFGGEDGLAAYLAQGGYTALIDATHPFAARMPFIAARAAQGLGLPVAHLKRPPWTPHPGERWQVVPDIDAAAAALPAGARPFLATGQGSVAAFARRHDCEAVLRAMTPPAAPLPPHMRLHIGKPLGAQAEADLLLRLGVTHVVAKNSGGPARGKLDAALACALPVLMVARPAQPEGRHFGDVESTKAWVSGVA